jgi:hypothetical protein
MKNYLLLLLLCFVTVQSKSVPEPPSVPIGPFDVTGIQHFNSQFPDQ